MNEPSTPTCLVIGVFCLIYAMIQAIKSPGQIAVCPKLSCPTNYKFRIQEIKCKIKTD